MVRFRRGDSNAGEEPLEVTFAMIRFRRGDSNAGEEPLLGAHRFSITF